MILFVAVLLIAAASCYMREMRARRDKWETFSWWTYAAVTVFVFTWPAWVLVALVLPRKTL